MKKTKIFAIIIYIFLTNFLLFSSSSLYLNPDSYSCAVGDTIFSNIGYVSASGITEIYQPRLYLSRVEWVENINFSFLSYTNPFSFGNLSFEILYLDYGEIQGIDMYLNEEKLPLSYEAVFNVSYAKEISKYRPVYRNFGSIGINVKFLKSQLTRFSEEAISLDVESMSNLTEIIDYLLPQGSISLLDFCDINILLSYKNFGSTMKFVTKEFPLPSIFNIGLKTKFHKLNSLTLFISNSIGTTYYSPYYYSFGLSIKPFHILEVLFGYRYTPSPSITNGFTSGFNVNLKNVKLTYSFKPYKEFSTIANLGVTHQVSLSIDLGGYSTAVSPYYIQKQLIEAHDLFYVGRYDEAKLKLDSILELSPDEPRAKKLLSKIEQTVEKLNENKQKEIEKYLVKAKANFGKKNFIKSKFYCENVLKLQPDNQQAKQILSDIDAEIKKLQQQKLEQKNAKKIEIHWRKATVYFKQGRFIEAQDEAKKIIEISPNHEAAKNLLSDIQVQLAKLSAENINSLYLKGIKFFEEKKYEEAIKFFEAVLVATPDRIDAKDYLDKCKMKLAEIEEEKKRQELEKAQRENKEKVETLYNRAIKLYEKQDFINALNTFEELKSLAEQLQFNEYYDNSNKYIEEIKLRLAEKYYTEGYRHYQNNNYEKAFESYKMSLKYNPDNIVVSKELEKLSNILADQYYSLGMDAYTKGDFDKARGYFKKSLFYKPDKEEAQKALERIK